LSHLKKTHYPPNSIDIFRCACLTNFANSSSIS
jgi:hypothetical protein